MSTNRDLIWTDHQGGKLGYYLDEEGRTVLCDYIGDVPILFLPSSLGDACNWEDASSIIPDDAFQSCSDVQLIIMDCRWRGWEFGYFTFKNCKKLKGVIKLLDYINDEDDGISMCHDNGKLSFNEFSITNCDYTPNQIEVREMSFERYEVDHETIEQFVGEIITRNLANELFESLRTSCDYTDIALERYSNSKWIEKIRRKGIDTAAFIAVSLCWNDVKKCT